MVKVSRSLSGSCGTFSINLPLTMDYIHSGQRFDEKLRTSPEQSIPIDGLLPTSYFVEMRLVSERTDRFQTAIYPAI
jgi:hypothetical protein